MTHIVHNYIIFYTKTSLTITLKLDARLRFFSIMHLFTSVAIKEIIRVPDCRLITGRAVPKIVENSITNHECC